jgi:hypothetical protein
LEPDRLPAELALQYRELVPEREDLDVLVAIAAWQQPQQRERVGDAQVRQSKQHEPASCAVTDDDGHGARRGERSKIESLPKWRPISTDALFGRHRAKDAEILVLRHQIVVLERHLHGEKIRFTPADRALLAALLHRLPRDMLRRIRLLVRPETVLRWPAT